MFHPDNIKNFHGKGEKVAISLHMLFRNFGGTAGVARALDSDTKVSALSLILVVRYSRH